MSNFDSSVPGQSPSAAPEVQADDGTIPLGVWIRMNVPDCGALIGFTYRKPPVTFFGTLED
jgi:hypothetical protein